MTNSTAEIRQEFLDFFRSKKHQVVVSSSLVPKNDPTLLFTNAGMNQFKDVFLGLDNRSYRRATTSQRCVRAGGKHNDLENVGYTARHHTFFEMLGNFSFGDYFKQDAIKFAWELLTGTQWFKLPQEKLWVTVYATDDEAYNIWANEVGVPTNHIICIGDNKGSAYASDNFWQMGDTGPCGPCSEIFYDQGDHIWGLPPGNDDSDRYLEIWNLVFLQFNRQSNGTLLPLPQPSVDTGMGLERIASVLQHVHSNYDIDLFKKLIAAAASVTGASDLQSKSLRVIADHIRSCAFLISEGVMLSNEGRGYVLRRIIRRAIRHGKMLGAKDTFFYQLVAPLIEVMGSAANKLRLQQTMVEQVLRFEEEQFARTLERGLALLYDEIAQLSGHTLTGDTAFRLYDTYGFPLDLTTEVCRERNIYVDKTGFERFMAAQRKRARQSKCFRIDYNSLLHVDKTTSFVGYDKLEHQGLVTALFRDGQLVKSIYQDEVALVVLDETPFYGESGGQVGDQGALAAASVVFQVTDTQKYGKIFGHLGKITYGELTQGTQVVANVTKARREQICLNHSATHLLHASLHQVLGKHVKQKGSLVNDQYLRFDFSHHERMTREQINSVEDIINQQIRRNLLIKTDIMTLKEALNKGAITIFDEQYEELVRVVSIGNFSLELCCGTHASCTGEIGLFRIVSESGTAAGIRRIEAITGDKAWAAIHQQSELVHQLIHLVKGDNQTLVDKVRALQERTRQLEKEMKQMKNQQARQESALLSRKVCDIKGINVLISQLDNVEPKMLQTMVDVLKNQWKSAVIVLATVVAGQVSLIVYVTKNLTEFIKAGDIVSNLAQQVGGKGGGRPDLAQGGGSNSAALPNALVSLKTILTGILDK